MIIYTIYRKKQIQYSQHFLFLDETLMNDPFLRFLPWTAFFQRNAITTVSSSQKIISFSNFHFL